MMDFLSQTLVVVLSFLAVLTLVITIHELGHFYAGRLFRVKIDRFSIGFGKAVFSRTDRRGVEWRLGWIPLGGYVKFAGDVNPASVPDSAHLEEIRTEIAAETGAGSEKDYFHFKPVWQRAIIVAAGPVANFVLAILIFAFLALIAGEVVRVLPRVASVEAGSPAAAAGFQEGDLVVQADGRRINEWADLQQYVLMRSGEAIRFTVERAGERVSLTATPGVRELESGIDGSTFRAGYLGLAASNAPENIERARYGPVEAVGQGFVQTFAVLDTTLTYLRRIITGRESGDQLSGPLGIATTSGAVAGAAAASTQDPGEAAGRVFLSLLTLAGLLSVGIGFLNLLPVPVLDGGHLVFYAYEAVARRPLAAQVQEGAYRVGLALLVCLMLFATWNDLRKLSVFDFLGGLPS